jgi:aminopeptidase
MTKFNKNDQKLAEIIINHSTNIQENDLVILKGSLEVKNFLRLIYKKIIDKKAFPFLLLEDELLNHYFLLNALPKQLTRIPKFFFEMYKECDAVIKISGLKYPDILENVPAEKIALKTSAYKKISNIIHGKGIEEKEGKKWVNAKYPTLGDSKDLNMPYNKYKKFIYNACILDWEQMYKYLLKIKKILDKANWIRIYSPKLTDLKLKVKNRGFEICNGKVNLPGGEIFCGPVEDKTEGYITYAKELNLKGRKITNLRLEFSKGKVIKHYVDYGKDFIDAMLKLPGVRRIGELGIGANKNIKEITNSNLFNEKINGTIHTALGYSYDFPLNKGGGKNKAQVHIDIVCDLRNRKNNQGGELWADDILIQKNGIWQV